MKRRVTTLAMFGVIRDSATAKQALEALDGQFGVPQLRQYVGEWMDKCKMSLPALFQKAGIEKSMGYKIFAGKRRPGRDMLIRMAFALGMDLEAAQRLLALGGMGALYPRSRRDTVIIRAFMDGTTLDDVQDSLIQLGEPSLWKGE